MKQLTSLSQLHSYPVQHVTDSGKKCSTKTDRFLSASEGEMLYLTGMLVFSLIRFV